MRSIAVLGFLFLALSALAQQPTVSPEEALNQWRASRASALRRRPARPNAAGYKVMAPLAEEAIQKALKP
jgi:hypothetical protein